MVLGGGGTSLYGVVPVAGSPSPLMYYGDYQFDWLCAYTVVLLGTSITGYNRLCMYNDYVYWCTCDKYNLALKYALYQTLLMYPPSLFLHQTSCGHT